MRQFYYYFSEEPYVEETTHSSAEDLDSNAEETELPDPELVEVTRQPLRKLDNCVDRSYGCEGICCYDAYFKSVIIGCYIFDTIYCPK